ncbi:hypothetical protein GCM10017764_05130 [Sphingobacterium griseoflavum]|uniref:Uncharacterized protein n=1 Tax=Sphingobacterium griseoflavum TaxID=1474952 RepID=A0ABQ3HQJ0_9SPHI|nr:hypothetical protein GCM10017764_05130 [Sphingobacterium griseoflavum]
MYAKKFFFEHFARMIVYSLQSDQSATAGGLTSSEKSFCNTGFNENNELWNLHCRKDE